jgi:glucose-6-phosphate isomerase
MTDTTIARTAWSEALRIRDREATSPLASLFAGDPERFAHLSRRAGGLLLDVSKQRLTPDLLTALVGFAEASGFDEARRKFFGAGIVNRSESRPALHWALRRSTDEPVIVEGRDVMPDIRAVQRRMRAIADAIGNRTWLGATGQPVEAVVHLGIGGSDLGPRMAVHALAEDRRPGIDVRFVSNVDPAQLARTTADLDPARTLLIVCSKSFRTPETLANANAARAWLASRLGRDADLSRHVVAVSANVPAARAFGIADENVLPMWDWVGGRFSLWSAVGLPIAIAVGWDKFAALLAGAETIDRHFEHAAPAQNLPLLLALVDFWNVNALGITQRMTAPYSSALDLFTQFIQQCEMESNGKSVREDGTPVEWTTASSVWGTAGTDAQHSYFQWLHQGNVPVNVELIVPVRSRHGADPRQTMLLANAVAQAQALLVGRTLAKSEASLAAEKADASTIARVAPHRVFSGNRISTTLVMPTVDPHCLGQLCALYEHKTFAFGALAGIDSFDQWGVELGKTLAVDVERMLNGGEVPDGTDSSTAGLVAAINALRARPSIADS